MYLNSRAAYDDPVPMWLLRFVRLTHNNIVMEEEQEALDNLEAMACQALADDEAEVRVAIQGLVKFECADFKMGRADVRQARRPYVDWRHGR